MVNFGRFPGTKKGLMNHGIINFGRYPGKGMPNIYIPATLIDRILEGIAILLATAVWVLALVFCQDSLSPEGLFMIAVVVTLCTGLFLWCSRAPVHLINFPVRPTEQNIESQYWLMAKFARVMSIIMNLLFLFVQFSNLETILDVEKGLFSHLAAMTGILLGVAFLVYFMVARRYR